MKVLVTYASKAGSTKGIAESVAARLRERSIEVDVSDVKTPGPLDGYDAFVVGSAVYMGKWMKEARQFLDRNYGVLRGKPVWLFSSGPVGLEKVDAKGRDVRETSGPGELGELRDLVHPRDHRVFFGALYGEKLGGAVGITYRFMRRSKSIAKAMPDGDYRDWDDIGRWATGIADALVPQAKAGA